MNVELFHYLFLFFMVSIVFWPKKYLMYGRWIPLILALGWIIFDGCPLNRFQEGLNDELFSQVILKRFVKFDKLQTTRFTHFILIVITAIAFYRTC